MLRRDYLPVYCLFAVWSGMIAAHYVLRAPTVLLHLLPTRSQMLSADRYMIYFHFNNNSLHAWLNFDNLNFLYKQQAAYASTVRDSRV